MEPMTIDRTADTNGDPAHRFRYPNGHAIVVDWAGSAVVQLADGTELGARQSWPMSYAKTILSDRA